MRPASPQTWQAAVWRTLPEGRALSGEISLHYPKRATPSGLVEEVKGHVREEADAFAEVGSAILVRRRVERPIDEHRPANHIFLWDEAPVPAIKADVAVIPHPEIAVFGNDDVLALNMSAHQQLPLRRHVVRF